MEIENSSFLDRIQVTFYSSIDHQIHPVLVNWAAVSFKETILGSHEKVDIHIQAPLIPPRWLSIQVDRKDHRVDFSVISGPFIVMQGGEQIQEGAFYMPQTLLFEGLGELRFKKVVPQNLEEKPSESELHATHNKSMGLMKDRYRILRILGEGGFSHVALAQDELSNKQVAIKVIHHKVSEDRDLMEKIIDRFFQEMKILIQLKHRNVTRILDYGFDHGTWSPFYVMEYVNGRTLIEISAQFTGEDRWDVADILLKQFLEGLGYLHQQGVIHRDLKPENILVSGVFPDFEVKILDLGLAKMLNIKSYEHHVTETQERETFGTPPYMSPEQCLNAKEVTAASDVYSAGILACILYCNQYPYEMTDHKSYEQIHVEDIPSYKRISPLVPESILKMIHKAFEKRAENRFQNAQEMLLFWQNQESSRFIKKWSHQIKTIRREWVKYFFIVLCLLLILVLLWIYFYKYAIQKGWLQ